MSPDAETAVFMTAIIVTGAAGLTGTTSVERFARAGIQVAVRPNLIPLL